ncbi:MAG TPA: cyclic nucleotide-binding domain-containing protein [Spirochaetales bacterium]|nr:cyclic nucleotide-binding domain-containing protein [Spirochaetales bacterium]
MRQLRVKSDLLIEELRNTLIFQNLTVDELKRIAGICEHWEYEGGEEVVTQDSVSRVLYVLLDGTVDIKVRGVEATGVTVSAIQKGDVFGEAGLFMDVRRTASAIANGPIRFVSFNRDPFFAYCNDNPRAGLKIFTFVIYSLLRKLGATSKGLALERESMVTPEDLERLKDLFPRSIEEIFKR